MSSEKLRDRLHKVRQTGKGRWLCSCPSHEDKSPSLAVTDKDDGRTLIHCFGGCNTQEVLEAVGLTFADLMPESISDHLTKDKRPFAATDALRALNFEAMVVLCAAKSLVNGNALPQNDIERLLQAIETIQGGITAVGVNA